MSEEENNFLSAVDQKEIENIDSSNSETFTKVQPIVKPKGKSSKKKSSTSQSSHHQNNLKSFKATEIDSFAPSKNSIKKNNQTKYKPIQKSTYTTPSENNSYQAKYHNIPTFQPKKTPVAQIVIFIISILFLLIALFLFGAFVYPGFFNDAKTNSGTDSASSNTATLQAVNPIDDSNLAQSIPNLVTIDDQNFVLTSEEYSEQFVDDQREYALIYTNGTLSYGVIIGQWEDDQATESYFESIEPASDILLETGEVEVGEFVQGHYILYQDELDPTQGILIWQNETLLIRVEGEVDTLMNFYYAYTL